MYYVSHEFIESTPIKDLITQGYQHNCWSLPRFSCIKEEEDLLELFTKSQDKPTIYHGDKVEKMIDIGEFSTECFDLKDFATKMITNYAHNVGGEVRYMKSCSGGCSPLTKKASIVVPNDAPYLKDLQEKFEIFLLNHNKIQERYDLRHIENKSLPENREETKHLEQHKSFIRNEFIISVALSAIFGFVLLCYFV